MDLETLSYFIRTNRDGRAAECKGKWKKRQNLDYPYFKGANGVIYEHDPYQEKENKHETDSAGDD